MHPPLVKFFGPSGVVCPPVRNRGGGEAVEGEAALIVHLPRRGSVHGAWENGDWGLVYRVQGFGVWGPG